MRCMEIRSQCLHLMVIMQTTFVINGGANSNDKFYVRPTIKLTMYWLLYFSWERHFWACKFEHKLLKQKAYIPSSIFNVPTNTQEADFSLTLSTWRCANLSTFSLIHSLGFLVKETKIMYEMFMSVSWQDFLCELQNVILYTDVYIFFALVQGITIASACIQLHDVYWLIASTTFMLFLESLI